MLSRVLSSEDGENRPESAKGGGNLRLKEMCLNRLLGEEVARRHLEEEKSTQRELLLTTMQGGQEEWLRQRSK